VVSERQRAENWARENDMYTKHVCPKKRVRKMLSQNKRLSYVMLKKRCNDNCYEFEKTTSKAKYINTINSEKSTVGERWKVPALQGVKPSLMKK
jgi:hypothetical protein